ncbi:MAG: indole-3-glycerol phosphate synthase TrpC [Saprospiraceae bacterium]|nr:indole-3-glycerol phosphate synthase TrpC [Saprospiraceae bacterium]
MDILEKIIATKRIEVADRKTKMPVEDLERSLLFERNVVSMSRAITEQGSSGIISEFKRRSPSKGVINASSSVEEVIKGYAQAGCAGISVLTDQGYFGGHVEDLVIARRNTLKPILRKEFIIDEYQIIEAKAIGADLVLLIAEVLTAAEVKNLAATAQSLGLEVLLEMHTNEQLPKVNYDIDIVGINNRNLKTFEVDLDASIRLFHQLGDGFVKISESGLSEVSSLEKLISAGFQGFLIGENFMKTEHPGLACSQFIKQLNELKSMQA